MPRKSQAEMIADLERKLEEARNKAQDKVKTDIEKLHARRELLVQREAKIAADILKIDEEIAALVTPEIPGVVAEKPAKTQAKVDEV
jgi:hypothetical protein